MVFSILVSSSTHSNLLVSLQKLFSSPPPQKKSNFRILDIQISWCQTSRNTFYWITWEVNTVWMLKKNFTKKLYKICDLKTSPRPFYLCKELGLTSIGKLFFFKEAIYIRCGIAKLSACRPSQISSYREFLGN